MTSRAASLLVATVALLGCQGNVVGAPPAAGQSLDPGAATAGTPAIESKSCSETGLLGPRVWRLTSAQYLETVTEVLELPAAPELPLEQDPIVAGFGNDAGALSVSARLAEQLQKAAVGLARDGLALFPRYSGCDESQLADEACVGAFIGGFGARAFRRPLEAEEITGYLEVYRAGLADDDPRNGVSLVIQTLLQSPHLLYRSELGIPAASGAVAPLANHELASALSYSLWGTPPDAELLAAAASGSLQGDAALEAQAQRLLGDPRAQAFIADFSAQWLGLQAPGALSRDPTKYPGFAAMQPGLFDEFRQLAVDSWLGPDSTLAGIFSRPSAFPAESHRVGLLTSGALVASWSRDVDTNPMSRGKHLLERVLCQALPPPPPAIDVPAVPTLDGATTRERYAAHAANPTCAGCHETLDGVAFALEHFDSAGQYRDAENGKPIDASGQVQNAGDADGPFADMAELAARLAESRSARSCLALHYLRFSSGGGLPGDPGCLVERLVDSAKAGGDSPRQLVLALVKSDFFRKRRAL